MALYGTVWHLLCFDFSHFSHFSLWLPSKRSVSTDQLFSIRAWRVLMKLKTIANSGSESLSTIGV